MEERLKDPMYRNWLKCQHGLQLVKQGVKEFVQETSQKQHQELQQKLITYGQCQITCTKPEPLCKTCDEWKKEISKSKKGQLIWKNAKPCDWPIKDWEVAKVFMGHGQHKADKDGVEATDPSALLQLMSNNKFYLDQLNDNSKTKTEKIIKDVIEKRNALMHSSNLTVEKQQLQAYLDTFIVVLKIPVITNHAEAQQSIIQLEKLKNDDLRMDISPENEMTLLQSKLDEIERLVKCGRNTDVVATFDVEVLSRQFLEFLNKHHDLKLSFGSELQVLQSAITSLHKPMADLTERMTSLETTLQKIPGGAPGSAVGFDASLNYKQVLNEKMQQNGWKVLTPEFERPDFKDFVGCVTVNGRKYYSTKQYSDSKTAIKEATYQALKHLAEHATHNQPDQSNAPLRTDSTNKAMVVFNSAERALATPGSEKAKLDAALGKLKLLPATYQSTKEGGKFTSRVKIAMKYLWSVENSIRGKKVAEQEVAQVLYTALNLQVSGSAKETIKGYCDKNRLEQVKYYTYPSPLNVQDFFSVALFTGAETATDVVFHGPCAITPEESEAAAAGLVNAAFTELDLLACQTSQVQDTKQDGACNYVTPAAVNSEVATSVKEDANPTPNLHTPVKVAEPCPTGSINHVSKLNQFIQQARLDNPEFDYKTHDDGKQFKCTVKWTKPWPVKVTHNPQEDFSSKKEAEKHVAQLALKQHFSLDESVERSKNKLNELFQRKKLMSEPTYEVVKISEQKFTASVSFQSENVCETDQWFDSKKKAKEHIAQIALKRLL